MPQDNRARAVDGVKGDVALDLGTDVVPPEAAELARRAHDLMAAGYDPADIALSGVRAARAVMQWRSPVTRVAAPRRAARARGRRVRRVLPGRARAPAPPPEPPAPPPAPRLGRGTIAEIAAALHEVLATLGYEHLSVEGKRIYGVKVGVRVELPESLLACIVMDMAGSPLGRGARRRVLHVNVAQVLGAIRGLRGLIEPRASPERRTPRGLESPRRPQTQQPDRKPRPTKHD